MRRRGRCDPGWRQFPDHYSYSEGELFNVTQTATRYSVITITLHKVIDGNYHTAPISAAEFDKAGPDREIPLDSVTPGSG
jgi:tetraacyldisaccharide-1-P 4'-kinase